MVTSTHDSHQKTPKQISFGDDTNHSKTVHMTMRRLDFSFEEARNYWYSSAEIDSMRQEASDIGRQMDRSSKINDQFCTRGLEAQTTQGSEVRRRVQMSARTAVFREQQRQRLRGGPTNEYSLALAYEEKTTRCQVSAITRGIADKLECDREWRNENVSKSLTNSKRTSRRMRRPSRFSAPRFLRMRVVGSLSW